LTRTRSLLTDLALALVLAGCTAVFAAYLWRLTGGLIPQDPGYYGADADRVTWNLIDARSSYHRLNVHPLFGLVCVAFQRIFAHATDLTGPFRLLATLYGAAYGATVYACVRVWGGGRLAAAAGAVLGAATAGFITWVAIPEQHVLGGLTVLGVFIMARWVPADPIWRALHSAAMFGLSYSITVTNAASWLFAKVRYDDLVRGRPKAFLRENVERLPEHLLAILGGLGIIAIGMAITWYGLYNRLMGRLLDIFREGKYVTTEPVGLDGGLKALGIVNPDLPLSWLVSLTVAALLLYAVWRLRDGPVFIPIFGLFAVVLHSAYGRTEAFLYCAEYTPSVVVALALAAHRLAPRAAPAVLVVAALALGTANLGAYRAVLASSHTLPLSSYGPVQEPPHSIPPLPPGILRH
jgi:hypothetical protein